MHAFAFECAMPMGVEGFPRKTTEAPTASAASVAHRGVRPFGGRSERRIRNDACAPWSRASRAPSTVAGS